MRVLMLVATAVLGDVRVCREAAALATAGHRVDIVGRDVPIEDGGPHELLEGVTVWSAPGGSGLRRTAGTDRPVAHGPRSSLRRAARWLLLPEHRRRTFWTWARRADRIADRIDCDVVHAHDFTALALGARQARRRGVPLVYDAHELWSQRHRSGRPTPLERRWERRRERLLGSHASAVLTVGQGLADTLRRVHGWGRVDVVRNTFEPSTSSGSALARPAALLYAGRLAAGRDLETVARASADLDLPVRLLGPADLTWLSHFERGRCELEPPVAADEVDVSLREAGLALVTIAPTSGNHRVALPNKLFQAVAAGIPVVASDVGELARMVRTHRLGVLYRPGDASSLVAAVAEATENFEDLVESVRQSQDRLSWSVDRATLLRLYDELEEGR